MNESNNNQEEKIEWVKPKVGNKIQTPAGICIVTMVSDYRWSGRNPDTSIGYVNVPFYEGNNWKIFKVLK